MTDKLLDLLFKAFEADKKLMAELMMAQSNNAIPPSEREVEDRLVALYLCSIASKEE